MESKLGEVFQETVKGSSDSKGGGGGVVRDFRTFLSTVIL